MPKLLLIASSRFGPTSKTGQIAGEFITAWRTRFPSTELVVRDLGAAPVPHLGGEHFAAFMTPEEQLTPEHRKLTARSDALIEEVEAAATIVIAVPMHNFTLPSTLKAWIDHITRAGRTFRYTENGPEGLLGNKRLFIVTGRGGIYSGDAPMKAMDFQERYLKAIFGFLGIDDITFIHIEGLKISPETAEASLAQARKAISEILPRAQAA